MRASHRLSGGAAACRAHQSRVLEVGDGLGTHVANVQHSFYEYTLLNGDVRVLEVAQRWLGTNPRSNSCTHAGARLPWPDGHFDTQIATHVLEHLTEPDRVVCARTRVVRDGDLLTELIPTNPALAWWLERRIGLLRCALRRGIAYDYFEEYEYINLCRNLLAMMRHHWPDQVQTWWPMLVPSKDLNLSVAVHTTVNRTHP